MMSHEWHSLTPEIVINDLKTNREFGLSSTQVLELQKDYGFNTLPEPKTRSILSIFLHQFFSPLIYLLLFAGFMAFFISDQEDAIVIGVVVLLNSLVGAFQEGRAEKSLAALRKLTKIKARVIRDGKEQEIESTEIVPGDILHFAAGDAVAADCRIFESSNLFSAEATLTGESVPVAKSSASLEKNITLADRHNMLYAGTLITSGRAVAVVVATGINNEIGKIAKLASGTIQTKTQLEKKVDQFGRYIVVVAILVFIVVVAIGLFRGIAFNEIFMIAISQMVSLVPEGLPVALTISLAVGVQRMAKKGVVIRRLAAVETLGSITVICTDKTGTLTKNEMTVTTLYLAKENKTYELSGVGYIPEGEIREKHTSTKVEISLLEQNKKLTKIVEACVLCNDSQLISPKENNSIWQILGDPTEAALLTMSIKLGFAPEELRKKYQRMAELPFDSETKMMATQHVIDGKNQVYIKGAPEAILELCRPNILSSEYENIICASKKMGEEALRVLAVAVVCDSYIDGEKRFELFKGHADFLGLIGELDPPRDEVKDAVRDCLSAGIKPVMVTGDHKATGLAIARTLGIATENDLAYDGKELETMTDEDFKKNIDRISVFARVQPAQKLRIIEAFQNKKNIVAMTGDGVNDAPALVKANVGVAMGISGTEVAKEAAEVVITDDNFSTIVSAISEGRLVYQNIKKLVLFLFVTSIDEVLVLLLALIMGYPPPLAAVQILWINLVAEGTLTVNLIMEPFEGDEMRRMPIPVNEALIDRALLLRMPLMVIGSVTSTIGWFMYRTSMGVPAEVVQTETFTVLVVSQWFNALNCRSSIQSALSFSLLKNPWLLGGLIIANVLHVLVIYWSPLARFFHTVPIAYENIFQIGIVSSLVLWPEELRKFFVRRKMAI